MLDLKSIKIPRGGRIEILQNLHLSAPYLTRTESWYVLMFRPRYSISGRWSRIFCSKRGDLFHRSSWFHWFSNTWSNRERVLSSFIPCWSLGLQLHIEFVQAVWWVRFSPGQLCMVFMVVQTTVQKHGLVIWRKWSKWLRCVWKLVRCISYKYYISNTNQRTYKYTHHIFDISNIDTWLTPKSEIRLSVCPLFSPPRHALVMGHDLDVTNTWPQPLLEDLHDIHNGPFKNI